MHLCIYFSVGKAKTRWNLLIALHLSLSTVMLTFRVYPIPFHFYLPSLGVFLYWPPLAEKLKGEKDSETHSFRLVVLIQDKTATLLVKTHNFLFFQCWVCRPHADTVISEDQSFLECWGTAEKTPVLESHPNYKRLCERKINKHLFS